MARLPTYDGDPLPDSLERMELALNQQRKADKVQSFLVALVVLGLLAGALYLISVLPRFHTPEVIVTYQQSVQDEDPVDRPDMAVGIRPKPTSASSSMARVLAAPVEGSGSGTGMATAVEGRHSSGRRGRVGGSSTSSTSPNR